MLKKIGAIIVSICIFSACFTGCDNEEKKLKLEYEGRPEMKYINAGQEIPYKDLDLNGREIKIAAWWDPQPGGGSEDKSEAVEKILERDAYIEQQYNCKIKYMAMVGSEMMAKIQASVESGDPVFDVGNVLTSQVPMLATKGYLQNLNDVEYFKLDEEKWAKFPQKIWDRDGKKYTFSMDSVFYPRQVVLWNKTMFEKNNWPNLYEQVEQNKWNWDVMLDIAQKATSESDNRYGLAGFADLMQAQMPMSNNAQLIGIDSEGKPYFGADSPEFMETIQFMMDLNMKYKVVGEPEAPTWDAYTEGFKDGKTAMLFIELYMVPEQLKDMKDDFGVVPPPMGPKSEKYSSRVGDSPVQVMLANNPDIQQIGYILDLMNEPYPDFPEVWRAQFETFLRDDKSVEMVKKIGDEYSEFDNAFFFGGARSLIMTAISECWFGDKTPGEAMGEIKTMAEKNISDIYESWSSEN